MATFWGFVDSPHPSHGPRQRWDRAPCPAWPSTGLGGNLGHLLGLSALVLRQQWGICEGAELQGCFPCTDTELQDWSPLAPCLSPRSITARFSQPFLGKSCLPRAPGSETPSAGLQVDGLKDQQRVLIP